MLEFIDGFDHSTNPTRKWDGGSTITSAPAGRFGGLCYLFQTNICNKTLTAVQTRVIGFALFVTNVNNNAIICQMIDGATTQVELRWNTTGNLVVTRNATVLGTSSTTFLNSTWYYIEWKVKIDNTTGTWEVRAGGAGIGLSGSGDTQNTANATTNLVRITGANQTFIDDLYVLNTSGSLNTDFLGECRILTSLPTGDNTTSTGTNKLWTPNAGTTHYTQVDEATPDDDTTYVSSATPGQIDTYTFPAIAPTGPVVAVQVNLCNRKDDAGARTLCAEYRSSGGTNYAGTNFSPLSTYAINRELYETDPATGVAWVTAGVNGGEYGVNCVA